MWWRMPETPAKKRLKQGGREFNTSYYIVRSCLNFHMGIHEAFCLRLEKQQFSMQQDRFLSKQVFKGLLQMFSHVQNQLYICVHGSIINVANNYPFLPFYILFYSCTDLYHSI